MALSGSILELLGVILVARVIILSAPGLHLEAPGAPYGHIFWFWQRFYRKYENHTKTWVFQWFFNDFRGPEGITINEKSEKIDPGVLWNAKKPGRVCRIG